MLKRRARWISASSSLCRPASWIQPTPDGCLHPHSDSSLINSLLLQSLQSYLIRLHLFIHVLAEQMKQSYAKF